MDTSYLRRLALIVGVSLSALVLGLNRGEYRLPPSGMVEAVLAHEASRDYLMLAMGILPGFGMPPGAVGKKTFTPQTITATGAQTISVPSGATTLVAQIWAPGGGGSSAGYAYYFGGGGGGFTQITLTGLGASVFISQASPANGIGGSPSYSWVNKTSNAVPSSSSDGARAMGGACGYNASGVSNGIGGSGSLGAINYTGGNGASNGGGGGGAGSAGNGASASGTTGAAGGSPDGGAGGNWGSSTGSPGAAPGGGGGSNGTGGAGGSGGAGQIILTWS